MEVSLIKYNELEIPVETKRLKDALLPLDRNENGIVEIEDFTLPEELRDQSEAKMRNQVADAFENSGMFKYPSQRLGLVKLFELYPQIAVFEKTMNEWQQNHIDSGAHYELEFRKDYWKSFVEPRITENGDLTKDKLNKITIGVYSALNLLYGNNDMNINTGGRKIYIDNKMLSSVSYNECAVTNELKNIVDNVWDNYAKSAGWLFSYQQIECEDWGCKWFGDEVSLEGANILFPAVSKGVNTVYSFYDFSHAGDFIMLKGGCFTGDTFLKTASGKVITMEEASRQSSGLVSYDECSGGATTQHPTEVYVHPKMVNTSLIYVGLRDENGTQIRDRLQVTKEHPLLVLRNGGERWVKAGDLVDGDALKGFGDRKYTYSAADTVVREGTYTLYNLSFGSANLHPTYYVSPDGENWIVAHNKM